jgi:hypothetical protein
MRYASARLEARLSPLGTDFGDTDPIGELRQATVAYAPSFTAAVAFDRGAWRASGLAVRAVASCDDARLAADEVCLPLAGEVGGSSDVAGRARFAAWPLTRAAFVLLDTRHSAEELARALRERVSRDEATVALVLMDDDLAFRSGPERAELQSAAVRLGGLMEANRVHDAHYLDALARPPPAPRVAPTLTLSPVTVAVIPRLSALGRMSAFVAEIEAAAGQHRLRWIQRP